MRIMLLAPSSLEPYKKLKSTFWNIKKRTKNVVCMCCIRCAHEGISGKNRHCLCRVWRQNLVLKNVFARSFLHRPQKIPVFYETRRAHIEYRDIRAKFLFRIVLIFSNVYFGDTRIYSPCDEVIFPYPRRDLAWSPKITSVRICIVSIHVTFSKMNTSESNGLLYIHLARSSEYYFFRIIFSRRWVSSARNTHSIRAQK